MLSSTIPRNLQFHVFFWICIDYEIYIKIIILRSLHTIPHNLELYFAQFSIFSYHELNDTHKFPLYINYSTHSEFLHFDLLISNFASFRTKIKIYLAGE